jgi:hypothetical protein
LVITGDAIQIGSGVAFAAGSAGSGVGIAAGGAVALKGLDNLVAHLRGDETAFYKLAAAGTGIPTAARVLDTGLNFVTPAVAAKGIQAAGNLAGASVRAYNQVAVASLRNGYASSLGGGAADDFLKTLRQGLQNAAPKAVPSIRVNTAANAADLTIGELLPGLSDDAMVHLSPEAAESFVHGVHPESYFVRYGDVKHLTVGRFKGEVVLVGAPAYETEAATFVIKKQPSPGMFGPAPEGAGEYLNKGLLAPDEIVKVPPIPPILPKPRS